MSHSVKLQRTCSQHTGEKFIRKHLEYMLGRALAGNRATGWSAHPKTPTVVQEGENWIFSTVISFKKDGGRKPEAAERQWNQIVHYLAESGKSGKIGTYPWMVVEVDGKPYTYKSGSEPKVGKEVKNYYDGLNLDKKNYFDHLYNREAQIMICHRAVEAAIKSNFQNRFHTLLHGEPGCGKSDIMESLGNMLGPENEAWIKFDATSMTAAGVIKLLLENDHIPPVMFVEEIEKTDEKSLHFLLGIMDIRGEVRKINFNTGPQARKIRMVVIATANNTDLLKKVASGAIYSRFANRAYCPRPNRELLNRILTREVKRNNGDPKWIEPTLAYCFDKRKMTDPREIIPVMLQGQDDLFTGSYQEALEQVREPTPEEVAAHGKQMSAA